MALYDVSTSEKKASPSLVAGGTLYADSPIGTILPYGGASAPSGWFLCDGTAISRTTFSELFAVIGESFGAGDGSTTFNLPDMTGKTVMGVETGHALGASEDGALPNIKGETSFGGLVGSTYNILINQSNGAFKASNSGTANPASTATSTGNRELDFDASLSSTIYTDGQTKVDPANVRVNYIIKAKMIGVPADFLAKVDEAVSEAIIVDSKFVVPSSAVNAGAVVDYTFDITKSGYTPLGVVGTAINAGEKCALVTSRTNSSSQATVRIINTGSSAATPSSIVIYILYIKTS